MSSSRGPTRSNLASAMLNSKIRPRAVVGYGVKIFHPSPPNYVTRSPGVFFRLLFLACARESTRLGPCYEEMLSPFRGQTDNTDVNLLFTITNVGSIAPIKGNESSKTYELLCENHQNHRDLSKV